MTVTKSTARLSGKSQESRPPPPLPPLRGGGRAGSAGGGGRGGLARPGRPRRGPPGAEVAVKRAGRAAQVAALAGRWCVWNWRVWGCLCVEWWGGVCGMGCVRGCVCGMGGVGGVCVCVCGNGRWRVEGEPAGSPRDLGCAGRTRRESREVAGPGRWGWPGGHPGGPAPAALAPGCWGERGTGRGTGGAPPATWVRGGQVSRGEVRRRQKAVKAGAEAGSVVLGKGEEVASAKQAAAFDLLALSAREMASHRLMGHLTGLILSGNA